MPFDDRGVWWGPGEPYLAYDPGVTVRFLRSQYSWPGETETEQGYKPASAAAGVAAGWAAARPNPNLIPYSGGAPYAYSRPDGPAQPRDLLRWATLPPNFGPGSFQAFMPERFGGPLPSFQAPFALSGLGEPCPPCVDDAVAAGMKKILPELATAIGVQVARAKSQQVDAKPANVDPPVRHLEFNECPSAVVVVNDSTAFVDIVTHRVPRGLCATANQLAIQAESPAALMDVEVRVLRGGNPVPRFDSLNCPDFGTFENPATINILAIEDELITVQARPRTALAVHQVRALLRGWDFQPSLMTNLDSINGWRGQ